MLQPLQQTQEHFCRVAGAWLTLSTIAGTVAFLPTVFSVGFTVLFSKKVSRTLCG